MLSFRVPLYMPVSGFLLGVSRTTPERTEPGRERKAAARGKQALAREHIP